MARRKLSAEELAHVVVEHLGIKGVLVTVMSDNVYGWNCFAMKVPDTEPDIHVKMQRAVEELRTTYELAGVVSSFPT